MNERASDSTNRLVEALATGGDEEYVRERLDIVVRWLAGAKGPEFDAIDGTFRLGNIDEDAARRRSLEYVDPILFHDGKNAWQTLGLKQTAKPEEVKQRYYRLTKIYHPDRQHGDEAWLNERTEKLNRAYQQIRRGVAPREVRAGGKRPEYTSAEYRPGTASFEPGNPVESTFGVWLRKQLGGGQKTQRSLIGASIGIGAILIMILSLQDNEPYVPNIVDKKASAERVRERARDSLETQPPPTDFELQEQSGRAESESFTSIKDETDQNVEPAGEVQGKRPDQTDFASASPTPESVTNDRVSTVPEDSADEMADSVEVSSEAAGVSIVSLIELETPLSGGPQQPHATNIGSAPQNRPEATKYAFDSIPRDVKKLVESKTPLAQTPARPTAGEFFGAPLTGLVDVPDQNGQLSKTHLSSIAPSKSVAEAREKTPPSPEIEKAIEAPSELTSAGRSETTANERGLDTQYAQQKARFFLSLYSERYRDGDGEKLARLYSKTATQDHLVGRPKIQDYYSKFFKLTVARELDFNISNIECARKECLTDATYQAKVSYHGGRSETVDGRARFVLDFGGGDLKILSVAY